MQRQLRAKPGRIQQHLWILSSFNSFPPSVLTINKSQIMQDLGLKTLLRIKMGPNRLLREPLQIKLLSLWVSKYQSSYCPCDIMSCWFYPFFFVIPIFTILYIMHPGVQCVKKVSLTGLIPLFIVPPCGSHCYPTKQINVRCKKVMMWCWTLTPQSCGCVLGNSPCVHD